MNEKINTLKPLVAMIVAIVLSLACSGTSPQPPTVPVEAQPMSFARQRR